MPAHNKLTIMAVDVKTQTSVLRKNISDYPHFSELEVATIASAKTLRCHRFAMASQRARLRRPLYVSLREQREK